MMVVGVHPIDGLIPAPPVCCRVLGQDTSPALPVGGGQSFGQTAPGQLSYCLIAYHHQHMNVWINEWMTKNVFLGFKTLLGLLHTYFLPLRTNGSIFVLTVISSWYLTCSCGHLQISVKPKDANFVILASFFCKKTPQKIISFSFKLFSCPTSLSIPF